MCMYQKVTVGLSLRCCWRVLTMQPLVMRCSEDAKWVGSDGNGNVKKVLVAVEKSVRVYSCIRACICDMRPNAVGSRNFCRCL